MTRLSKGHICNILRMSKSVKLKYLGNDGGGLNHAHSGCHKGAPAISEKSLIY